MPSTITAMHHLSMTYELQLPSTDAVRGYLAEIRGNDMLPPGTLHLLIGDFHGFSKLAIFIDDMPADPSRAERVRVLERSLAALSEVITVCGVALAVSRAGIPEVSTSDREWRDALVTVATAAGVDSHGIYLVTADHIGCLGGLISSST